MYLNRLFVYGTLLPGLENYNRFIATCRPKAFKARAKGIMYYLPEDGYPVVLEGEGEVKGVLFETRDMPVILPEIDEIEKYTGVESQSHLIREIKDVEIVDTNETVKAHMYLWPPSRAEWLKEHGVVIPDGDWARFLQEKK
ncbi:MAG: gamma-glutamylcyclotransferase [Peptococcaceae bacterium]|nr:gamma-glutamylcyclotransferase [Peptococcaceae bacterium]